MEPSPGRISESVKGVIPANTRLGFGFENLLLVLTDRRIIVTHKAKKGSLGLASAWIAGSHSGAFADPDKPKVSIGGHGGIEGLDIEKVLRSHRDNFEISYNEIVSVEVVDGRDSTSISMVTGNDKFQFFTAVRGKEIVGLLADHLGSRLASRRVP